MSDNIPQDLKYTKEHEWARITGKTVVVGVTAHAQESLGDVVYVELPKLGATLTEGKNFGVIESTKAVSDLFAPISGTVVKVNDELTGNPSLINSDPYGKGWIVEVEPSDAGQVGKLLDAAAYEPLTK
ncbi:glycine cleavage system protein GcvH [Corallococcus sp. AB049A]|uniref:Glycine cleavage system H protein n=1 Tax=Corallococcus interemptor TaxID=2316720 RepID=A0A3A8PYJ0_9BACT|nr:MULTISPECIES: glycine cleavage system protein GcvH [Corallococcus]RKH61576.1 glycine cleavage system protein GcvH [Corallococcus interemptor]RKI62582.1 glycine cleavage system protein GcvH [Corallococcus sp. AB049A]